MQTRSFPSEVFARLAPDLYFKRHIENGQRPTGRKFTERRPIEVRHGDRRALSNSLGSAVVRAGGATVVCGITGSMTRFKGEGGIYANVEIHRGGSTGNPSLEEQILTMSVHRLIQSSKFDPKSFIIDNENDLCLSAQIVVLSRTGPMLDLVWQSLVSALKSTNIPTFEQNERTLELSATSRGSSLAIPIGLADLHWSYGFFGDIILADLDGAVEEECVVDRVSIAYSSKAQTLTALRISSPHGLELSQVEGLLP